MAAIVVIAVFVVIMRRNSADDGSPVAELSSAKYQPAGDEGLGASIALVLDVSGSMKDRAAGDNRPKYVVAQEALQNMLRATDSLVARQPGFTVNVGLYTFSNSVRQVVPIKAYNRDELSNALASLDMPRGGTAIGDAMDRARQDLYKAGTIRKYILVVTDGENTDGRKPDEVAREIARRSEGAVRQYFVAFDIDKRRFAFLEEVNGEVFGAAKGLALQASLDSIYRGRILAEAMNAGETLPPDRRDSGGVPRNQ
jgi:uncharacterized protein YegL